MLKTVICIIPTATTRVIICHSEKKLYFDEESLLLSCVQGKDSSLTLSVQNDSGVCPLPEDRAFFHQHNWWLSVYKTKLPAYAGSISLFNSKLFFDSIKSFITYYMLNFTCIFCSSFFTYTQSNKYFCQHIVSFFY